MLQKKKFDYKWIIFACCFLMTFVCLGFCSGNKGLYLTAFETALKIKRSVISINDSCRYVATGIINLFFGTVIYRFGVRKTIGFGFATLIASCLVYATANTALMLYVGGALLGTGLVFTSTTMASSIVRRWFKTNIGKYTGIVLSANGIGGAVAAQIVSPMINEPGNPFGYRKSYYVIAAILLVVGILVVALLQEQPKDGVLSAPAQKKKARGVNWVGIDYNTAKRRPYFYLTAAFVLLTGFILQGISGIYVAHMKDVGLDAAYVATVVSAFSLGLTFSKILVGAIYDRAGLRLVMLLCQGATVIAFIIMAFLDNSALSMGLGFVFAALYSFALPLETLVIPLIVNDLFGSASYDQILGIMSSMNYLGFALGAPVTNLCFDTFGSYKPVLLIFSLLMIPIGIAFQLIIGKTHKQRTLESKT